MIHILKTSYALGAVLLLMLSACRTPMGPLDRLGPAPVPEAPHRMTYALPDTPRALSSKGWDALVEGVVCLVLSGEAEECMDDPEFPVACTIRSEEDARQTLQPLLEALPELRLDGPETAVVEVPAHLQARGVEGALATTAVYDARRKNLCHEWDSPDGACLALRFDRLWILLHAPQGSDQVDTIDVFLAEWPCDEDIPR